MRNRLAKERQFEKAFVFLQYRGKCTDDYARALHRLQAPCTIVMTLRKLRTVLPSLKPPIPKELRSGIVYQIQCPRCDTCSVCQTDRHWQIRFKEPVAIHLHQCGTTLTYEDTDILVTSSRGEAYLITLEALWIRMNRPEIKTKYECKSRTFTIKL